MLDIQIFGVFLTFDVRTFAPHVGMSRLGFHLCTESMFVCTLCTLF